MITGKQIKHILLLMLLNAAILFPQEKSSDSLHRTIPLDLKYKPNETTAAQFNSPEEIRLFADFLYCDKDYLRAAEEYQKLLNAFSNDTLLFKQGLAFSIIGDYGNAADKFNNVAPRSKFYLNARNEQVKIDFLNGYTFNAKENDTRSVMKLSAVSKLLNMEEPPAEEEIAAPFNEQEKQIITGLHKRKSSQKYKSPLLAGIFSAIIPGTGKMYTGNYSDGFISLAVIGLMYYLAYTNFTNDHTFRGVLFTGLGIGFNAGNIYGSVAGAQIYNARLKESFEGDVKEYIKAQNYFIEDYGFCR